MAPHGEDDTYHPKDAIAAGLTGLAVTGGAGLFVAAFQNATSVKNVGAWGVFTRGGHLITTMAASGGVYLFAKNAAANLRQKDDAYNAAIGGGLAGAVVGMAHKSMPRVFGFGAGLAVLLSAASFTGGLQGNKDKEADEFSRKEAMRMNRRRPIEETLAEVGEGRSIRPPGYEERRRERLKERYGVDIKTYSADPNAPQEA